MQNLIRIQLSKLTVTRHGVQDKWRYRQRNPYEVLPVLLEKPTRNLAGTAGKIWIKSEELRRE